MARLLGLFMQLRFVFALILGAIAIGTIVALAFEVARDLRLLNSARSDNVQWTLSQTEVEFLEFDIELEDAARASTPDFISLRREFDIFYSRINTLKSSAIYAPLRELPQFSESLAQIRSYLDATVPFIDADDAALKAALPDLTGQATALRPVVRGLSTSGLIYFATESDARRGSISVTLTRLATALVILLVALALLAVVLGYLNSQNMRRRAEAVEAGRRMQIITSTSLDAVIVSDDSGRVLDFNAAAEQIFGVSAQDAIGADLGNLIVPDHHRDAHKAGMARMRTTGERRVVGKGRVTLEAKRANGQIFPVELALQSAQTDAGEIFIAFLRDISHRVEAQTQLETARDRALAGEQAKTDFLATMSHEIRTPLNGLLGNLTLLQDTRLTGRQSRYVDTMIASGKLLMRHVTDVLDITKYDAGKMRLAPVDMNLSELMQDMVDNQSGAAHANNTVLTWGWTGPRMDWIHADRDRIQHVLLNLIGNAVKFTKDGRITIDLECIADDDGDPQIRMSVEDTGIGIAPDIQEQIFDDFMTGDRSYDRAVDGTGLGLGIARRFVDVLGGQIALEKSSDQGSRFTVILPVEPASVPMPEPRSHSTDDAEESKRVHTRSRMREIPVPNDKNGGLSDGVMQTKAHATLDILLVEDNEINRMVASEMIVAAGHTVTEAFDGRAAVALCALHRFDLIFMDISMPVMDGRTATRAIRSGDGPSAKAPIVALTANAMAEEQAAFLQDGMTAIVTKPLSRKRLLSVIVEQTADGDSAPTDNTSSAIPAVSSQHFEELRDMIGPIAFAGLLERFVAEFEAALPVLTKSLDMSETTALAHRNAGSAATLGAMELRATLIDLENAAASEDAAALLQARDALPDIWTRAKAGLLAGSLSP